MPALFTRPARASQFLSAVVLLFTCGCSSSHGGGNAGSSGGAPNAADKSSAAGASVAAKGGGAGKAGGTETSSAGHAGSGITTGHPGTAGANADLAGNGSSGRDAGKSGEGGSAEGGSGGDPSETSCDANSDCVEGRFGAEILEQSDCPCPFSCQGAIMNRQTSERRNAQYAALCASLVRTDGHGTNCPAVSCAAPIPGIPICIEHACTRSPEASCQPELNQAGIETGFESCSDGSKRRRAAMTCPTEETSPTSTCPGIAQCNADWQCTDQALGYCAEAHALKSYCGCFYGCQKDADCGSGSLCECGVVVGRCVQATCKTNDECVRGFGCAATDQAMTAGTDCSSRGPVLPSTYTCQTAQDECRSDNDCPSDKHRCAFDGTHRVCVKSCLPAP
jgi:hypothetical protein